MWRVQEVPVGLFTLKSITLLSPLADNFEYSRFSYPAWVKVLVLLKGSMVDKMRAYYEPKMQLPGSRCPIPVSHFGRSISSSVLELGMER